MDNSTKALVEALAVTRRRYVLSILSDHRRGLREGDLATMVASMETGDALRDVSEDAHRRVRIDIRHRHLPKLEAAGLIRRDDAGTVSAADNLLSEAEPVAELLEAPTEVTETQERVLENAVRPRRRAVLSVLEASAGSLSLRELGERVVTREEDAAVSDVSEDRLEETLVSLHHVDLPKLEDADLLAYDPDARTVTRRSDAEFDDEWLDESAFEAACDELSNAQAGDVWTLEGRENVIARGQSLFEEVEDELFIMITTDGLLEEGCITRLQDALDRGVDVYVGSQTWAVRDLVRRRVPEATIWEPQLDWLNLPPHREKLGRLVLADREAILLGSLGEPSGDGVPVETAVTGEGEDNSLVILMRELLGSRIDHLDHQSADFLDHLPL
ncbi:DUF7344 domain-containing protein [Halopelagius fulvigenes]|uniref:DUF7344 domain-containing protein n=1 Tax=Halopelagius fulvigenes TaxID=1198324 RepID=A0ABD5U5U2_9EURY